MPLSSESPAHAPTLMSLSRQRRREARRPYHAAVEMVRPQAGEGVTLNVSEGGLRIAVDTRLRRDDTCLLYVHELGSEPSLKRARVAWSRQVSDGWIVGLELLGLH